MTTPNANIEAIYPLSPIQAGILFHCLYAPDAPLYIQQYVCTITGDLDLTAFQESWDTVIARHEVLRSLLTWEGRDQPLQIVRKQVEVEWQMHDWRGASSQDDALADWLATDRARGFDLEVAPLLRLALLRTGDRTHQFVWTHHHIIIDGWSIGLVLKDVFRLYAAAVAGSQQTLPPAPSYRGYVRWLKGRDTQADERHWRDELSDLDAATPLPISDSSPRPWAEDHASVEVRLDRAATARLTTFGRSNGFTLNTILRGAWAFVLSKYSGTSDVTFGATNAGRPPELSGALEMVGLFINTLPVRLDVRSDVAVGDWLKEIQQKQVEAAAFEMTPLSSVQSWSGIPSGDPIFESLLVVENVPNPELGAAELTISDVRYLQRSNYPLAILAMPGDELELILLYDSDRFEDSIIRAMGQQLGTVVAALVEDANRNLGDLQLLSSEELNTILHVWNQTEAPYPDRHTIHDLIVETAGRRPERVAVTGSGTSLTYAELDARATSIARTLVSRGLQRGDRVGVNLERSPAAVAAILGILKAGAAYVPLDPELPLERIEFILQDTAARGLVTTRRVLQPERTDLIVLEIDAGGSCNGTIGTAANLAPADAGDLAYVLYTSGSTGQPKGVAVSHRALVNSTHARQSEYEHPVESFLLLSPLIFDSSIAGLFWTLCQGGTLVLPAPRMEQDVHHLGDLVADYGITHTLAIPSLYQLLLELVEPAKLKSLRLVMVAGEACPPRLAADHYAAAPEAELVNEYGPTEATVWCTVHHIEPTEDSDAAPVRVPIGRPIANTQVFLLDGAGMPVPAGVPGELYVGGAALAEGYWGRPEQTAAAFVDHDLPGRKGIRLYRTGDIARFLPDGTIDLLGRADQQVKIRGQRIELGEIEATLRQHPDVRDAAVVLSESATTVPTLAAFVETETSVDEIRRFLADRVPRAMVPATIDALSSLPRGVTGKVDKKALPDPALPAQSVAKTAPEGPVQQALAAIWCDVLGVASVGANEDFFELGGDSILSIRVIARGHKDGLRITPKQFFDAPTIAGLAEVVGHSG